MRTTLVGINDPPVLIPSAPAIDYWLIDADTPVLLPWITTNVGVLKPRIVTANLETNAAMEVADKYLSVAVALVIMDPYDPGALTRFTALISLNGLTTKADALIDTTTSLNFVSKEFVMANGFYKDCKTTPKLVIRVASEQRISTTKNILPFRFHYRWTLIC